MSGRRKAWSPSSNPDFVDDNAEHDCCSPSLLLLLLLKTNMGQAGCATTCLCSLLSLGMLCSLLRAPVPVSCKQRKAAGSVRRAVGTIASRAGSVSALTAEQASSWDPVAGKKAVLSTVGNPVCLAEPAIPALGNF